MAEIIIKEGVITFYVAKINYVVADIIFKVASVADYSLFVAKITFVESEIIIKENVITSSVATIIYVVVEITSKVVVVTSSVTKITFVVD